jgi:hypothetical protein
LAQALGDAPDTITNLTTSIGNKLPLAGGTMSGAIAMGNNNITGVGTPSAVDHAATKGYVDTEIQYLDTAAQGYAAGAQQAAINAAETNATNLADAVAGDLTDHENATVAHGATGAVVGTTNTQTLTNKTIGDTLNFTGAGAMTINSDSHIVLTPAAGSSVKWGADVLATQAYVDGQDTDDIAEGSANLYFTNARAIAAVGGTIGDAINLLDTDDIEEGSTNLYFTNSRALSATSAAYDVAGAAAAADTSARGYADSLANDYDAAGSANTAYSDAVGQAQTFANNAFTNASAYADGVGTAANGYTDGAIGTEVGNRNSAISDAIATEVTNRNDAIALAKGEAIDAAETYADNAVSALVGSAPALLDTLQELAAALDNDPETINTLQSIAANKADASDLTDHIADTSTHGVTGDIVGTTDTQDLSNKRFIDTTYFTDGVTISNEGQIAVLSPSHEFEVKANVGPLGLKSYNDDIVLTPGSGKDVKWGSDVVATRSYADEILADVLDGTTAFTEINVNSEAKQIAASSSGTATVVGTAYQWAKADYRSAKLLVKIDNGTDNEMSEILVTLDSTDNIAITEYAIVGTNGSRGTITADISGANVRVRVTPTNNSTVKVSGTLLK